MLKLINKLLEERSRNHQSKFLVERVSDITDITDITDTQKAFKTAIKIRHLFKIVAQKKLQYKEFSVFPNKRSTSLFPCKSTNVQWPPLTLIK